LILRNIYHDDIKECTFWYSELFNKILIPFDDVIGSEGKINNNIIIYLKKKTRISTVLVRRYPYLDHHRHRHRLAQVLDHFCDDYKIQQSTTKNFEGIETIQKTYRTKN
jgi:hypothetical protein